MSKFVEWLNFPTPIGTVCEPVIKVSRREVFHGRFEYAFDWAGDPKRPVQISLSYLSIFMKLADYDNPPEKIDCFPWPLRLVSVENLFMSNAAVYVRTDGANWLLWLIARIRASAHRNLGWLRTRIVLTGMIWGFGYVPSGEIPRWKHLKGKRN